MLLEDLAPFIVRLACVDLETQAISVRDGTGNQDVVGDAWVRT